MASIKVKFRPSTVAGHEGTIYYQIIHERKVRQLLSPYKILPEEWNESRATVTCSKESERKKHNSRHTAAVDPRPRTIQQN